MHVGPLDVHVISRKKLRQFWAVHPDAEPSLGAWWRVAKTAKWQTIHDAKAAWGASTDTARGLTVFNIGGNKYRLIAYVNYQEQVLLIRHVLTHAEYCKGDWKSDRYYSA
jgi:mRNA interferase HigB